MSVQSTLTGFYSVRKRSSVEEIKKHSKVRIIDECITESSGKQDIINESLLLLRKAKDADLKDVNNTSQKAPPRVNNSNSQAVKRSTSVKKAKVKKEALKGKKAIKSCEDKGQASISSLFFSVSERVVQVAEIQPKESVQTPQESSEGSQNVENNQTLPKQEASIVEPPLYLSPKKKHVVFEKMGNLSPRKVDDTRREENEKGKEIAVSALERHVGSQEKTSNETAAVSGKTEKTSRKDLSLSEIRGRLLGSKRLAELRQSLAHVSSCAAKIREADREISSGGMPSLQKFEEIQFEVPVLKSPAKTMPASPIKSPPKSPIPAYQRFSHLTSSRVTLSPSKSMTASPSKGSPLSLPYQYRCLAEVFRCVDVVVSIMVNRKEKITFNKLRPAAQEMLRKNVNERHLGQIKKVFPNAYEFKYEKVNQLTVSSAKAERYELIMIPVLKSCDDASMSMTPSVLLERRHEFHKCLLEMVKDHHEEFLQSLDPPMTVPREKLTRWHPLFEVDILPEVEPAELPQPPDAPDKCSSAKDVLDKARDLFGCNTRMERALAKVSVSDGKDKEAPSAASTSSSSSDVPFLNPALRGIPPALLKKVRERQAAKAMMAMTMSPAEEKRAERLSRLPELARVLRGIFVSERKGVLSLDQVIQKLLDSYKAGLSTSELHEHLKLLEDSVPGWVSRCTIRNAQYIKLSRDADVSRVISKLERLSNDAK
ncbi:DNA replication factor Cdt1 [Ischnura elegans]|uniref:DNA replication factor Cdt1 n=1 Tax=Ischnura elegans TaxID=197161 RepID=UPI001ED8762C|nr:DNA replication factor Cdt1 [Ischnura elegans]